MTYDPRKGQSPYLGMDDNSYDDEPPTQGTPAPRGTTPAGVASLMRGEAPKAERQSPSATVVRPGRSRAPQDMPPTVRRPSGTAQYPAGAAESPSDTVLREAIPDIPAGAAEPYDDGRVLRRPARPAPQPATQAAPYAVPSPQQADPYVEGTLPVTSRSAALLSHLTTFALWVLSLVLRVLALALSVVVVGSAVLTDAHRAALVKALNLASGIVPAPLLGQFVVETPFGGAFRGDLALAALLLFVCDWLCLRYRATLIERRERGE